MNRHEIQAEILQTIKVFGDCVLTPYLMVLGFRNDVDFEEFKAANGLASEYDKGSGQTTFTRLA